MKVAIVTDSNSCITQKESKELGVFVIPMPFMINGEEYFEDINLTQDEFYEKIEGGAEVVTSQPSPEVVMNLWDDLLKEYDEVVHIPMSSGLSGACQTAMMLADDYDDRVYVVNNQRICPTLRDSVIDAKKMADAGESGARIKEQLEKTKFDTSIYITVGTLEYLKKGGRITPAVAAIGNLLKIKPILSIHGEKLDSYAMARTVNHAKTSMISAIKNDMNELIECNDYSRYRICSAYSSDVAQAEEFAKMIEEEFPGCELTIKPLSLSVACHIGPSSLAIAVTLKKD